MITAWREAGAGCHPNNIKDAPLSATVTLASAFAQNPIMYRYQVCVYQRVANPSDLESQQDEIAESGCGCITTVVILICAPGITLTESSFSVQQLGNRLTHQHLISTVCATEVQLSENAERRT